MKLRLFAAKLQYRYETGCTVKLFTCTDEDSNVLNYLDEVAKTMFPKLDDSYDEYVTYEEITTISNCGEMEDTYSFIAKFKELNSL
jgi:hypothetical protein